MKILSFSSFSFLLLFFTFSALAKDCNELKTVFFNTTQTQNDLDDFKKGVDTNDLCYKNLMGVLLYEGLYFPKDIPRAESIFFDLSNKGNPEAQFNFAWAMSKKDDQNPTDVINLVLGIHYKYISDKKNNHLSSKARDLGRFYLAELPNKIYHCSLDDCKYPISKITASAVIELKGTFEDAIKISTLRHVDAIEKRSAEIKENTDNLVAVFSIGLAVYGATALTAPQSVPYKPSWHMTPSSGGNIYSFQ